MSHGGYGIAGHRNMYKTGVLNGNWVQDTIGMYLVKSRPNNHQTVTTESRANYINPKSMPNKCDHAPQGPVISRAEEVVPKHMLFGHGITESFDKSAGKHFVTVNQAVYGTHERIDDVLKQNSRSLEAGISPNTKTKDKFIERERERKETVFQTTARAAYTSKTIDQSNMPVKKTTKQDFTKSFRPSIPNLRG